MRNRVRDRSDPFKAQLAIARRHGDAGDFGRPHARPMGIELLVAEPIGIAGRPRDQFGAQYRRVERIRALPIADMNDTMVEFSGNEHSTLILAGAGQWRSQVNLSAALSVRAHAPTSASFVSRAYHRAFCRARAPVQFWRGLFH